MAVNCVSSRTPHTIPLLDTKQHQIVGEKNVFNFTKLPPELRVKIWKLCLPGPRIIHLAASSHPQHPRWGHFPFMSTACFPSRSLDRITILSVCRESRSIALPLFKFVSFLHPRYIVPFSHDQDVVMMDEKTLKAFMTPRLWKCKYDGGYREEFGVRALALDLRSWDASKSTTDDNFRWHMRVAVQYFRGLEEITFCLGSGYGNAGTGGARELELEEWLALELAACKIPKITSPFQGGWQTEEKVEAEIRWRFELRDDDRACDSYWDCHQLLSTGQKCRPGLKLQQVCPYCNKLHDVVCGATSISEPSSASWHLHHPPLPFYI